MPRDRSSARPRSSPSSRMPRAAWRWRICCRSTASASNVLSGEARGGASVSDVKRLRELEVENAKLKRMYRPAIENAAIRTSSTESGDAVREAAGGRGAGARAPAADSTGLPHSELSRTAFYQPPVPASRRDAAGSPADRCGHAVSAVGILEAV